jgi:hypothetical protein
MLKIATEKTIHKIEYEGATFDVAPNNKEEHAGLVKKHTFVREVRKDSESKVEYIEEIDFVGLLVDRVDTQVKNWAGIEGNPPCNSETKKSLALNAENEHICTHILSKIAEIGRRIEQKKEEKRKN